MRNVLLTVKCARKRHTLCQVIETDTMLIVEAPRMGQSPRRHAEAGAAGWHQLDVGAARRYGCSCGSTLLRGRLLWKTLHEGCTEIIAPVE